MFVSFGWTQNEKPVERLDIKESKVLDGNLFIKTKLSEIQPFISSQ